MSNLKQIVSVQNVSKLFQKNKFSILGFLDILLRRKTDRTFFALKDINFSVYQGEILGVLGQNGSGKSTLLKVVASKINPTLGKISTIEDITFLSDLSSGLDLDLTVEQNIIFRLNLDGIFERKQIKKFKNSILNFSELHEKKDTSVKFLSSGMKSRLGFAIATSFLKKILIIDEALAVGDAKFRQKCFNFINKNISNQSIIFVTHNLSLISSYCTRVIVINKGEIIFNGNTNDAISSYLNITNNFNDINKPYNPWLKNKKNISLMLNNKNIDKCLLIKSFELKIRLKDFLNIDQLRITFFDSSINKICEWNSKYFNLDLKGLNFFKVSLGKLNFSTGIYYFLVSGLRAKNDLVFSSDYIQFEIKSSYINSSKIFLKHSYFLAK